MTPENLARLHARAMTVPAPWNAHDFKGLTAQKGSFLIPLPVERYPGGRASASGAEPQALFGFALGRVVLDEAELLTFAVDPNHQRQGHARDLLARFEAVAAQNGAATAHLEVAATNTPALGLYRSAGWRENGRRKDYYKAPEARIDAILMAKRLTSRHGSENRPTSEDSY